MFALTRRVPASFAQALCAAPPEEAIDLSRARAQHAGYCAALTLAEGTIPREAFGAVHVVTIPAAESYAANVLAAGDRVLVSDGFPRTHEALARAGFQITPLPTTEFRKADGALTCLSILC